MRSTPIHPLYTHMKFCAVAKASQRALVNMDIIFSSLVSYETRVRTPYQKIKVVGVTTSAWPFAVCHMNKAKNICLFFFWPNQHRVLIIHSFKNRRNHHQHQQSTSRYGKFYSGFCWIARPIILPLSLSKCICSVLLDNHQITLLVKESEKNDSWADMQSKPDNIYVR